ncbi:MAG: hypothetical protein AAGH90_09430 [Pseudomonadota bacterium]
MPPIFDLIALLALGFCALLGLGSLFSPTWAAGVVRLVADPDPDKPGGFSEFRATYGGLLLFLHLTVILILLNLDGADSSETRQLGIKAFVLLPVAAAWIGAGVGRTLSLLLDKEENRGTGLIPVWIPMEFALGLAIAAPILALPLTA